MAHAQFGLVAEEVEKVNPDLVVRDKEGKPYSVRYDQVNAMLLNEFLKEHQTVQELRSTAVKQEATIAELKSTVAQQQKGIEALTAGLQKVSAQLAAASPSRGGLEAGEFATRTNPPWRTCAASGQQSLKLAVFQRLIPTGERSGLQTRIA